MQLFFTREYNASHIILSGSEAEHCIRVLRHKEGAVLNVINGKGDFFITEIDRITKDEVHAQIIQTEPNWNIFECETHLIFPYLKSRESVEWAIEKAVELGVTHIHFTPTARSERAIIKRERVEKIMISTIKQCLRGQLPEVNFLKSWNEALEKTNSIQHKFVAFCEEKGQVYKPQNVNQTDNAVIAIGPEGDFTASEVNFAQEYGFQVVSLGRERLRSETAIIYMLSLIKGFRSIGMN